MIRSALRIPAQDLRESGYAGLLENHARLLGMYLQLWSPDLTLILSEPASPDTELVLRIRPLVQKAFEEGCDLFEALPDGRHLYLTPIWAHGKAFWILSALLKEPLGSAYEQAVHRGDIIGERGSQFDASIATGSACLIKSQEGLIIKDLAFAIGQHLDLTRHAIDVSNELVGLRTELHMLNKISGRMAEPANARQTIEFIMQQGCSATGADLAILQLPDTRLPIVCRNPIQAINHIQLTRKELRQLAGQLWWQIRNWSTPLIHGPLNDLLGTPSSIQEPTQVCVGRIQPDQPKAGFLALVRAGAKSFEQHELGLLHTLIEQCSLALKNADLHENVNGFLMSTVKALVSAIETKDRYTSGHSARVNLIAMLLGKQIGLSGEELESLKWASILHDVGKIGMPESILNKPGRLNDKEFEVVRQHPGRGYEVLSHIRQLKSASQAVLFHHERIDGKGYPLGISGAAIPMAARIIAVADTFDALTSNRPYRKAMDEDEAHEEILRVRGSQLDMQVVDIFNSMLPFLKEHRVMLGEPESVA